MTSDSFDGLTRRASIAAFGLAGLAAISPLTVQGKQSAGKKAKKKCKKQVGKCEDAFIAFCEGNASCLNEVEAILIPCCQSLGGCNVGEFIACAFGNA